MRELDAARATAKSIRGDARETLIDRLRQLDASLIDALRDRCDQPTLERLAAEADEELEPFRARMPAEAYQQSHRACVDRLMRERAGLPTIRTMPGSPTEAGRHRYLLTASATRTRQLTRTDAGQ